VDNRKIALAAIEQTPSSSTPAESDSESLIDMVRPLSPVVASPPQLISHSDRATETAPQITVKGKLNGEEVTALVDSGAEVNFIDGTWALDRELEED
jgi:hypothetical protein